MMSNQKNVEMGAAQNFNIITSKITETQQASRIYNESVQKFHETSQSLMEVDNAYKFSRESFNHGYGSATFSRHTLGVQSTTALFDDIALSDAFLNDYYSQVLLEFHFIFFFLFLTDL